MNISTPGNRCLTVFCSCLVLVERVRENLSYDGFGDVTLLSGRDLS